MLKEKNYAFEFLEIIKNIIVQHDVMEEISLATFHTLIVDESTDISAYKQLIHTS